MSGSRQEPPSFWEGLAQDVLEGLSNYHRLSPRMQFVFADGAQMLLREAIDEKTWMDIRRAMDIAGIPFSLPRAA